MPSESESSQPALEGPTMQASQAPAAASVKSENDDASTRAHFSLDFSKFSSIDEACQCLDIVRDLACLESRVRKVLPNVAVERTLDTILSKADRNALSRLLSMSPRVLRIAKLINTPPDRDAVREALRYLKGLSSLEEEMADLPEDEKAELMRAHKWFSIAYKDHETTK